MWRFGRHFGVLEPGLRMIVPLVDRLQRVDLRTVDLVRRIEPGGRGRIRIDGREWDARTDGTIAIGPEIPFRISRIEGRVVVLAVDQ